MNFVVTIIFACVVWGSPAGFALGVAIHLGLRELVRIDPNFFHKWVLWSRTKAPSTISMEPLIWGGSMLRPSPSRVRRADQLVSFV